MKICVPSKSRELTITTNKLFKSAFIFVPEEQVENYKKYHENIVAVPSSFDGITKTRNFILDYFKNENILFIDDDLKEIGYFKESKRINLFSDVHENDLIDYFLDCFQKTKQFGFNIFGIESGGSLFSNHVFKPISYKGAINGTCFGICKHHDQKFNEDFEVKEDFEYILKDYLKTGGFLKFNTIYVRTKHWANSGGCVDYRTNQMESKCIKMLKKKYNGLFSVGKGKNQFHTKIKI